MYSKVRFEVEFFEFVIEFLTHMCQVQSGETDEKSSNLSKSKSSSSRRLSASSLELHENLSALSVGGNHRVVAHT